MLRQVSLVESATDRMTKKEDEARKVGADPNGGSVILSSRNRIRLVEERSLCGLPEILGSAPKVRWQGNPRRYPNVT
ncbi:unnamed protein product [Lasius platythorax]|uniref:Uncharacterized protein n=1 Tax=Lasius platythorax TaxID=488582 RepID=A0AAV2N504_9HYME